MFTHTYLCTRGTHKGFQGTVVNRPLPSFHGGSVETDPGSGFAKLKDSRAKYQPKTEEKKIICSQNSKLNKRLSKVP